MLKKLRQQQKGFTIIEVLIVLAIAALILLIVFLAVPALQRNSRNTSRKSDVAKLLAAINESVSNNNGSLPTGCSGTSPVTFAGTVTSETNVGYYNAGCAAGAATASGHVGLVQPSGGSGTPIAALSTSASNDWVSIGIADSCSGGAAVAGASRSVAAVYQIETGSGVYASVCQGS